MLTVRISFVYVHANTHANSNIYVYTKTRPIKPQASFASGKTEFSSLFMCFYMFLCWSCKAMHIFLCSISPGLYSQVSLFGRKTRYG